MTTPQDIIRAWCASRGMAEPSNGDVAALLSLLFPEMSVAESLGEKTATWQPIATAPKSGDVLLYCERRGLVRGRWNDCRFAKNPRPYWTNDREHLWGVLATRDDQPTHWMPFPVAPTGEQK
jgi:hypothetical protein